MSPKNASVKKPAHEFKVSIEFAPAAHVLEEIKVQAEREMRSIPMQIVSIASRLCGTNGELRDSNVGPAASGGSNQRSLNSPLAEKIDLT